MIIRFEGGNHGIASYLRDGGKVGRDIHRDELDHRVVLTGNLDVTDNVITSIEDKGQDRYLRVVISFYEDEVSTEKMIDIVEDYKSILMSAYKEEEYNFYAEAHIPRMKNDIDYETGELIERKTHIHVVIPKVNLVTGGSLNPVGLVSLNIDHLDAIQEHLNKVHDSVSPKDRLRNDVEKPALNSKKGDFFNERNQDLKERILDVIHDKNIRSMESFNDVLKDFGEVRVYNKGSENEYYGVKEEGDKKFTRLKNNFFSKEFIENREDFKTNGEIYLEEKVKDWVNKRSLEVKYISPASDKTREEYKGLNDEDKVLFLRKKEGEFYNGKEVQGLIQQNTERSFKHGFRGFSASARFEERLPPLPQRKMAYGLRGREEGQEAVKLDGLLHDVSGGNLAEIREEGQSVNRGVRRLQDDGRRVNASVITQIKKEVKEKEQGYNKELIDHLKKGINPDRFISACVIDFNVDASKVVITKGRDGTDRFSAGNRNLNVMDYLTKNIGLSVEDSVDFLIKVNDDELKSIPFNSIEDFSKAGRSNFIKEKSEDFKNKKNEFYSVYSEELKGINDKFYEKIRLIDVKNREERKMLKTFYNIQKNIEKERADRNFFNGVTAIKNEVFNFNKVEGIEMKKVLDVFSKGNSVEEYDDKKSLTYEELLVKNKRKTAFEAKIVEARKMEDFVIHKNDKKKTITFMNQDDKSIVFIDKGDRISVEKHDNDMSNIKALMKYSHEKFGGKLKLSGSEEFRTACAIALSELGLKSIIKPDRFHDIMIENNKKLEAEKQEKVIEPVELNNDKKGVDIDNIEKITEPDNKPIELDAEVKAEPTPETDNKPVELDAEVKAEPTPETDNKPVELDAEVKAEPTPETDNKPVELDAEIKADIDQSLTYEKLKEYDLMKLKPADNLLRIAEGLDDKSKEIYNEKINQSMKAYEATKSIFASEKVKGQIFSTAVEHKNDIAEIAKITTSLARDMKIKGRVNFSDNKFSMNSFKDSNNEKINLTMNFDGASGAGEIKVNDKVFNFSDKEQLKAQIKEVRSLVNDQKVANDQGMDR